MSNAEKRLKDLGIELPVPGAPIASFVHRVQVGELLFVSGQVSSDPTGGIKGAVGVDVSAEQAYEAARLCAVHLLAQVKAACGDLGRVKRVVRLGGFVQAGPEFYDIPKVINGASDLIVEVFGKERGEHTRAAVGVYKLPLNFAVEVDGIFEIERG
jgi:enamine deaminase RidA (YjgF/YER057c/UK114 family)